MKHLRKFDTVADLNTAIANSTIGMIGLAYNNDTPVLKRKNGSSPVPPTPTTSTPFYVENITNENETLAIKSYDFNENDDYLEITVEYSTDGTNWSTLGTTGETALTRTLQPNDKVYLRASTDFWYQDWWDEQTETNFNRCCNITGVSKVGGNIMSLLYGSSFTGNETAFPSGTNSNFSGLFNDNEENDDYTNTVLVSASELILPATTLADYCYQEMFINCSSLTIAPTLPATTLTDYCYLGMFGGCTSLTNAPALPATTLADYCYQEMFINCSSLTIAPTLPATTLAVACYSDMFGGCTSLTNAPALPATTLVQDCYNSMFSGCTSLTNAPTLPATTLASNCYEGMFGGCTSLTTAPVLPATTLTNFCYNVMFNGCTNLNYIKCLATDISAEGCTSSWVNDVETVGGIFVKDPNMPSWPTGSSGIPSGWTVQDAQQDAQD